MTTVTYRNHIDGQTYVLLDELTEEEAETVVLNGRALGLLEVQIRKEELA